MRAGRETGCLGNDITIGISPRATETEKYAAEMLQRDLKTYFEIETSITDAGDWEDATVVVGTAAVVSGVAPPDHREGYAIHMTGGTSDPQVLVIGRKPVGAMYGCFTLIQLFTKKGGRLHLPAKLHIEDYPVMETRGVTGSPGDVSKQALESMDHLARWRINTLYYQHFYPFLREADENGEMQTIKWTHECRPVLKDIVKEAHKRGMVVYGAVGARWAHNEWYFGEQVSYKNPRHRKVLLALWEQMAQCGVDGLMFLIDDVPVHMSPEEQGLEHVEWMRRIKEIADRHGIKRVMMCPTHYWRGWKPDYYKPFKEAKDLADLKMYFCPYAADEVAPAKAAGLRNYDWWYNGVHKFPGLKSGIAYMEYGWYGGGNEQIRRELRTLPERTKGAWLCGGGDTGLPVWGSYLWAPAAYETDAMQRAAADVLLGRGAAEPCMAVREHFETWVTNMRKREGNVRGMRRSEARAREALEQLKGIMKQEERPGLLPADRQQKFCELYEQDFGRLWEQADKVVIDVDPNFFVDTIMVPVKPGLAGCEVHYTLDGTEPTVHSPLYREPLVIDKTVTVKARVFRGRRLGPTATRIVTRVQARPADQPGEVVPGVRYQYYEGEWEKLPDFDSLRPVAEGTAAAFDISKRERDDRFAFRFTGYIKAPREGAYRFHTFTDDGVRVWIGDKVVVDDDGVHGVRDAWGPIGLAAGLHRITVEYFELAGIERLEVAYDGPGIENQIIPTGVLFHKTGSAK